MFCVTGNSVYLANKEVVLWPETRSPQGKIDRLIDELMEDGVDALRVAAVEYVTSFV